MHVCVCVHECAGVCMYMCLRVHRFLWRPRENIIFYVYDFYLNVCISSVCLVHVKSEDCVRHTGIGVTDGCELPRGHWELTLGPLEKECPSH